MIINQSHMTNEMLTVIYDYVDDYNKFDKKYSTNQHFDESTFRRIDISTNRSDSDQYFGHIWTFLSNQARLIPTPQNPFYTLFLPSVTRKKSPNVHKSCPKMIPLEKWYNLTYLQKLPKIVGDLDTLIVAKGFKKLPKVKKSPNLVTLFHPHPTPSSNNIAAGWANINGNTWKVNYFFWPKCGWFYWLGAECCIIASVWPNVGIKVAQNFEKVASIVLLP